MVALDFPATPVDGQSYGKYIYDATTGVWNSNEPLTVARFTPSPTAPAVPSVGDGWFNTNTGVIYIYYVSAVSGYWVQAGSTNLGYPSGASVVTSSTRPGTPFVGQTIYETNTGTTFTWDGTAWKPSSGGATVVTSSTRPASPYVGQFIYETDTQLPYIWSGSEWVVAGGGGGSIEVSATAPATPSGGDLWWDSDNGNLYIYYDDGNSQQWVAANGPQVFVGTTAPAGYQGQLWFDSTQGKTYIYYDDGTSAQWVSAIGGSLSGNVIQVVSTTKTNSFTTTSTSFTDFTGLSATITPRSTSSKILILVNSVYGTTNTNDGIAINLVRGSTNIAQSTSGSSGNNTKMLYTGSTAVTSDFFIQHLDSPATTSSLTYKIQVRNTAATNTIFFGQNFNAAFGAISSITLMEIAG